MTALSNMRTQNKILLFMEAVVLLTGFVYTALMVDGRRKALLNKVDARLVAAAQAADFILPPGYHDRISGPDSVSAEAFDRIVDGFNKLCVKLDLEYIWSVLVLDDGIVFTSATSPDKAVAHHLHAKFFDRHSDPDAFRPVIDSRVPIYSTFHNEWGAGRMVLIPRRDTAGRLYILGASVSIGELNALLRRTGAIGASVGLGIMVLAGVGSLLLARSLSVPLAQITTVAEKMAAGELDYPVNVSGSQELATLSGSFASMRDAIRAKIASLKESEENLAITLNSIGDAVIATDSEGRITRMNPIAERLTGWPFAEAKGHPVGDVMRLINAFSRKPGENPVDAVLRDGQIVGLANHTILVSRDGTERQIADSGAPICDAAGTVVGVVLVFRDVTEEYNLQQQLRQAQKMEAIGQLAGGVAHDFNNLLTGIGGNAEILKMTLPPGADQEGLLDRVLQATERATDLTRQLLSFSRKGKMQIVRVDVHATIVEVVGLLSHSIDKRIKVSQFLEAAQHEVLGDPSQLESAILNLALNARDAMPEGGELTFATRDLMMDEAQCRLSAREIKPGRFLEIAVVDTGIGMDLHVQERLFEPFYTTKPQGRGTGLGLASVYGCVKSHQGFVHVYSEPGQGSTFKILLPLTESVGPAAPEAEIDAVRPHGHGHILVVDDEEIVVDFLMRALRGLGYTVSVCRDGAEAVGFFKERHADIDLVILDLIMPTMGGADAFREIRSIDPKARVLIASGFSRHSTVSNLIKAGAQGFLNKPFRIDELAHEVARHISTVT